MAKPVFTIECPGWSRVERRWIRDTVDLPTRIRAALSQLRIDHAGIEQLRRSLEQLAVLHSRLARSGSPSKRLRPAHELFLAAIDSYISAVEVGLVELVDGDAELSQSQDAIDRGTDAIIRARAIIDSLAASQEGIRHG